MCLNVLFQSESDFVLRAVSRSCVGDDFYKCLVSAITVDYKPRHTASNSLPHIKRQGIRKVITNTWHSIITPEHVYLTLGITMEKSKDLLKVTKASVAIGQITLIWAEAR